MNDAIGYLVNWINPIRRVQDPDRPRGPQIFGHY